MAAENDPYRRTFIREWRLKREMNLEELAFHVNMDKGNLSKLERGQFGYRQETIERIAKALKVSVADLLERDPTEPARIWDYIDRAGPDVRRQIEAAAEAIFRTSSGKK